MKKLWLLSLFVASVVQSQPLEKSLLWKISGNGLTKPSYLFGTIHMSCEANIDGQLKKALDDTNQLYLELDLDDSGMQAGMMQHMMMPDGKKMTDLASPEDIKIVDAFLREKAGMGVEMMNTIKPVFVSMLAMPQLLDCPMKSIEQELMKASQAQNEPVFGLEEVEDQIAALDVMPLQEQMDELVKAAKGEDSADGKEEIRNLLAVYLTGDIELLLKLTKNSDSALTSKYDNDLLDKRNVKWIPKIGAAAKEKPTLFAVGAAHLAGDNGVIRLLRKAGFSVEAVR
ncbi:TraB/GumN family protein [Flavobacterium sp. SE-s28]|uniref:TraB/GumN family protein n=2 Tax=Flavobacterium silvaticum TaxID=1852020 RepID=A0A972FR64_9FLAO|nr:TraB/GumN family protein [Flavobacterium silvaticum]